MKALAVVPISDPLDRIKALVLDSAPSAHSRRAYDKAVMAFLVWFQSEAPGHGFSKAVVQRYARHLGALGLSASTVDIRLTAERQAGSGLLAVLIGCGLRRSEVPEWRFEHVQQRNGRWRIVDMNGKGNRVRSVPMPSWTNPAIDAWSEAAGIETDRVFRPMAKVALLPRSAVAPKHHGSGLCPRSHDRSTEAGTTRSTANICQTGVPGPCCPGADSAFPSRSPIPDRFIFAPSACLGMQVYVQLQPFESSSAVSKNVAVSFVCISLVHAA